MLLTFLAEGGADPAVGFAIVFYIKTFFYNLSKLPNELFDQSFDFDVTNGWRFVNLGHHLLLLLSAFPSNFKKKNKFDLIPSCRIIGLLISTILHLCWDFCVPIHSVFNFTYRFFFLGFRHRVS